MSNLVRRGCNNVSRSYAWWVGEIEGVSIADSDGRWIVARLREVGRADDATAAASIEHGLDTGNAIDWLSPGEKDAVMMVLADAPDSLRLLRVTLARDHFDRAD